MAAVDYFLKFEGIDGESHDSKHKNEIDLESWSWGETNTGTGHSGGGHGAGKVVMQDLHFVSKFQKSSPKLMLACACGEHINKATLVCRRAGTEQQEYLKIVLTDVLVSSYQVGGSSHGDVVPTDQFSLNYAKIEFDYKPQKQDGTLDSSVKAGYNIKENKKV
ncbi:MAG: type VI secretion system tube protein Hcp [Acidobacteria bacterium]|nr:type VI secretion system tube protein Hcp [Acidobacteriota bacterium]